MSRPITPQKERKTASISLLEGVMKSYDRASATLMTLTAGLALGVTIFCFSTIQQENLSTVAIELVMWGGFIIGICAVISLICFILARRTERAIATERYNDALRRMG